MAGGSRVVAAVGSTWLGFLAQAQPGRWLEKGDVVTVSLECC